MDIDDSNKFESIKRFTTVMNSFADLWKSGKLYWSTRLQFAGAIQVLLKMENENSETFANIFLKLVSDEDYRVRAYMATAVTTFFELFEDEEGILKDLNKQLPRRNINLLSNH